MGDSGNLAIARYRELEALQFSDFLGFRCDPPRDFMLRHRIRGLGTAGLNTVNAKL